MPFEFVFTPGDKVRFTAVKTGLYSNFKTSKPVNQDSVFIKLGSPCVAQPVVYDFDQNVYQTVQIGDQCWFRENLKTKHYADGTPLVNGTGIGDFCHDYSTKYWFEYNDDPSLSSIYGLLTKVGGKEILESQLAGYRLSHAYALNNVLRYIRNDTLCQNINDSIKTYLSNCDYIWARYQEVFVRNEAHDSTGASGILSLIPEEFPLSASSQT